MLSIIAISSAMLTLDSGHRKSDDDGCYHSTYHRAQFVKFEKMQSKTLSHLISTAVFFLVTVSSTLKIYVVSEQSPFISKPDCYCRYRPRLLHSSSSVPLSSGEGSVGGWGALVGA